MGKIFVTPDLLSGISRDTRFLISADFSMLLKRKKSMAKYIAYKWQMEF